MKLFLFSCLGAFILTFNVAKADDSFRFENYESLSEMKDYLKGELSLGQDKNEVKELFTTHGKATYFQHPDWKNTEKYIYDINLCDFYIWRWNISADYSDEGMLEQLYLNGETLFDAGIPLRTPDALKTTLPEDPEREERLFKGMRPRPEASKGEKSLAFMMYDLDGDVETITDQFVMGAGPSRANPEDYGKMVIYKNVDPWRSIFDLDDVEQIIPYAGECPD